ncbi:MAG: 30S ribosomal protein S9 [Chlamydiota bacterium]
MDKIVGVGRRKTAVSSVHMKRGTGKIEVNGRKFDEYFLLSIQRESILDPLKRFSSPERYDLFIRVSGGGIEAQVIATRLGISRALVQENEDFRGPLKEVGFLTRDPRRKERKKYGLRGARKRGQYSKR